MEWKLQIPGFISLMAVSVAFNEPILSTTLHGCDVEYMEGIKNISYTFVLSYLCLFLAFLIYFLTLWNIYQMQNKTDTLDSNREQRIGNQRKCRKRKRMFKLMMSLILLTLLISIVPAAVISFTRVTTHNKSIIFVFLSFCCQLNYILHTY